MPKRNPLSYIPKANTEKRLLSKEKGPINTEISISSDIDETWPVYQYLPMLFLVFHNEEA